MNTVTFVPLILVTLGTERKKGGSLNTTLELTLGTKEPLSQSLESSLGS